MMSGGNRSHHVDSLSFEDGVVGALYVKDTELCDNVERIRADWELDRAGGTGFAPVETVDKWLGLENDQLLDHLRSILHLI